MTCPSCGHDDPDRAKFCLECGAPFAARCASCGTELPPAAKVLSRVRCSATGVSECRVQASGTAAPDPELHSYTPKHLADKILQSKSALEGEGKPVTVPFADVKGSMELGSQVDSAHNLALRSNPQLRRAMDVVMHGRPPARELHGLTITSG
jgi:hypothetical protein